ncbi:MAG: CCA tRNA nucleotidyltransferase [Bacteroidota bacterium]|nr:CCA tRNA nucleotidyltransferase [Bacteroidota bacterium]
MADSFIEIHDDLIRSIGSLADELSLEIFLVGGFVRDSIMGKQSKDIDITVVGDGVTFARVVHKRLRTSRPVEFEAFGTSRVTFHGLEIEFVGTRKEVYHPHTRKPLVTIGTIEEDLMRRDFTVNAIAVSLNRKTFGQILDPLGGKSDIEAGILKTPKDPFTTFSEDPLRMMRACRFASQLRFAPTPEVSAAISAMADRITIVSMERVRDEIVKILSSRKPSIGFSMMREHGLLKHVFSELDRLAGVDQRSEEYPEGPRNFHHKDVFAHTLTVVDNVARVSDDLWLRMSALLHDIAKPDTKAFVKGTGWTFHGHAELGARRVKNIFRNLRLPFERLHFVEKLVALHLRPLSLVREDVSDSAIRRLLVEAGEDIDALMVLCRADITSKNPFLVRKYLENYERLLEKMRAVEEHDRLRNWQPPIRGDEIMALCNIPSGVAVGVLKQRVEDAILDGVIENTHEAAVAYLLSIKDEVLRDPKPVKPPSRRSRLMALPDRLKQ